MNNNRATSPTSPFQKNRKGSGTREWSEVSYNIGNGCSNGCLYCYARQMALRWNLIERPEDWTRERIRTLTSKCPPKKKGVVMFPTMHDISCFYLETVIADTITMAKQGRHVLLVTKPRLKIIDELCDSLEYYKDLIMFRFTIGSTINDDLLFWEPGAPTYQERLASLNLATCRGFKTSVSAEPLLGGLGTAMSLLEDCGPWVTDTVWIGTLNRGRERLAWCMNEEVDRRLEAIEYLQTPPKLKDMYQALRRNKVVSWKETIRRAAET